MEEINLNDLFHFAVKRLLYIVITIVFFCAIGTLFLFLKNTYVSKTLISVNVNSNASIVEGYNAIVRDEKLLKEVVHNDEVKSVASKLSITSANNTQVYTLSYENKNKDDAENYNSKVAELFVKKFEGKQVASILGSTSVNAKYSASSYVKYNIIYAVLGFFVSGCVIFVLFYFDKKIHSESELSNYNVIGELGNNKNRDKLNIILSKLILGNDKSNLFLISSVNKYEGADKLSVGLSKLLSKNNNVLLINLNDHNDKKLGFYDLLTEKTTREELKKKVSKCVTRIDNISLILSGQTNTDVEQLLTSNTNKELLSVLKESYDYIIINGDELKDKATSLILSKLVDKNLLVVKINETKLTDLTEVKKSFEQIDSNIDYVVVNKSEE